MAKIHVNLEFDTIAEVAAFFSTNGGTTKPSTPAAVADHLANVVKETKADKPAAAPAAAAPSPAPAPAPTPAAAPAAPAGIQYEQVGNAIAKLVNKDKAKAVEILKELGVKKGPELKAEQYADALAKFEAGLAAAELS